MKEFKVETNFGHTYLWNSEQIAQDYADTVIQFEDNISSKEAIYSSCIKDDELLWQWFSDYIAQDLVYTMNHAKLVSVDKEKEKSFITALLYQYGSSSPV
jgi:hypothetical protein